MNVPNDQTWLSTITEYDGPVNVPELSRIQYMRSITYQSIKPTD